MLGHLAAQVKQGGTLTVGEAAGRFDVRDRKVMLTNAAVQSPALGLVGSGVIGFDKSIELKVIAHNLVHLARLKHRGVVPA